MASKKEVIRREIGLCLLVLSLAVTPCTTHPQEILKPDLAQLTINLQKFGRCFFTSGCKWPLGLKIQDGRQYPYLSAKYRTNNSEESIYDIISEIGWY